MNHLGTRTLASPRLVLRRYTMEDVDAMYENWAADPEVARYLNWNAHTDKEITRALMEVWVDRYENDTFYHWAVERDGELIGDIAISTPTASSVHMRAELGCCLGRPWWGQGLMTEALGRVLQFLFEELGAHRLYMRCDTQNPAAGRMMEKCGMTREGVLRKHRLRKDGTWADIALYGILASEWPPGQ